VRSARIACVVTLNVEVFILRDGPDARLEAEATSLERSKSIREALGPVGSDGVVQTITALADAISPAPERPLFVVQDIVPKEWSVTFNSFRRADEFEITIPLAQLPVPGSAIRNITCQAVFRQLSDDDYEAGNLPSASGDDADFFGVGRKHGGVVVDTEIGTCTLSFVDYAGMMGAEKVPAGHDFDEDLPITEAVETFLRGTWAEGIPVKWVDPRNPEPITGDYKPALFKAKKGKKSKKAVPSQYTYLDAVTLICQEVGCVARVMGAEIQIAFAGTMYAGLDRGGETAATILVGQVVEPPLKTEHELVGQKMVSIQVVSFDPITHTQYTARWPADPKNKAATKVDHGTRAVVPPIVANLGRPGFQDLDDSIIQIPVSPVSNPELLPKLAEAIFLERTRQRTTITFSTHSPWSNPFDDTSDADLLKLRAGDNVSFGYLPDVAIPGEVRALTGQLEQGETQALLELNGIPKNRAIDIAKAIALVPVTDRLRVDEVKIAGGAGTDATIELKLVTFTVVTSDLQAKAEGLEPEDVSTKIANIASSFADATLETIRESIRQARQDLEDSDADEQAKAFARARLDDYDRRVMKGQ